MASMKGQVGGGDFLSVIRFSVKWQYVSGIAWKLVFTLDQRVFMGGWGYCMRDVLRWFVGYEGFLLGVMGFDLSARRDII